MASAAEPLPVLIVDADPAQRRTIAAHLAREEARRFRPLPCATAAEAERLAESGHSVLIADLESVGGPAGIRSLAARRPLIATSARGSLTIAVAAMRAGAADFLPKPMTPRSLLACLEAAVADWQTRRDRDTQTAPQATDFKGFVGRSPAMLEVYGRIERIGASRAPVLILGATGTGKEVAAAAIHAIGGADRPFVAVNCAALPKDLVESEIFGHVRGAFTGADGDHVGAAELARGGTLFLDEIAEMPASLQAKLLRFVQGGEVRRVGGSGSRRVDVRILAATNRDLPVEIAAGRFREDLFHRLNVLALTLPALSQRGDDIVRLAAHFLARAVAEEGVGGPAEIAPAAAGLLTRAAWPGNVRQLENVIRRTVVLHRTGCLTEAVVAEALDGAAAAGGGPRTDPAASAAAIQPFHVEERRIIEAAVAACGGSVTLAAAALGLDPSTIYRRRRAWSGRD